MSFLKIGLNSSFTLRVSFYDQDKGVVWSGNMFVFDDRGAVKRLPSLLRQSRRVLVSLTYQSTATITATPGDQIYLYSDGTKPIICHTYTVPIVLGATNTIKAIA
jgi:hypothetical protein